MFNQLLYGVRDPVQLEVQTGAGEVCFVTQAILYHLDADADVTISIMEVRGDAVVAERVVFQGRQSRAAGDEFAAYIPDS